jgi:outer membrane lipoprotein LolB
MFKNIFCAITCILTLFIAGCMQRPDPNAIVSKQSRIQCLQQMQNWKAEGRVAIQDATQSQTASFKWQQNCQQYKVYIYSPFSTQSVTITGDATSRRVLAANGLSDPELALDEHLPLAQLGYWAKGLPTPNSTPTVLKYDSHNQLQQLQQDGWQIEYQKYQPCVPVSLPEKLTLTDGTTKVKLVIRYDTE